MKMEFIVRCTSTCGTSYIVRVQSRELVLPRSSTRRATTGMYDVYDVLVPGTSTWTKVIIISIFGAFGLNLTSDAMAHFEAHFVLL